MKKCLLLLLMVVMVLPLFSQSLTVDDLVYGHIGPSYRDAGQFGVPWGKHEAPLRGVPTNYDWANGARPGSWMNYGSNSAITSWGQVYEIAGDSPERNVRVQIRNFKAYAYVNAQWVILEEDSEALQAGWYSEDFTTSAGWTTSREEPSINGGGRSFEPKVGYNIHFWTSKWPRSTIPSGAQAFYVVCEARLIPDTNPNVDLSNAKYLIGVSNDYYPTTTSSGHGPWPSLSISRHTYVTAQWKSFNSYIGGQTPTSDQMYRNDILSRPLPPGVGTSGNVAVSSVSVSPTSATITVNSTQQLTATVAPSNATNKNVSWSSSNTSVATVNSSGLVTGVAAGSATITVTTQDGAKTATSVITVSPPNSGGLYSENFNSGSALGWSVINGTWSVIGGEYYNSSSAANELSIYNTQTFSNYTYSAKVKPMWDNWYGLVFNYQDQNNYYYVWLKASTNIELRRVLNGITSTLATSTYTGGGQGVYSTIEVNNNGSQTSLKVNGANVFTNVSTANWANGKIGFWTDWNPVYFDDVSVVANVIAVTGVSVSPTSATIVIGGSQQLTAMVAPSNATNKAVNWSSSNTSIATVNSNGVVTVVAPGSATITVTTQNGNYTATSAITVPSTSYSENFNDNTAQGWVVLNGTWNATSNQYYNSSTSANERSYYNSETFSNYVYTAKARPTWNNWYGMIFNFQDASNYYYVFLKASVNIELRRVQNGVTTTLFTGTYSGGGQNQWSTVDITNNGTTTSVKVNGGVVFNNVSTPAWTSGKIGLWTDFCPVYFDDMEVSASAGGSGRVSFESALPFSEQEVINITLSPNPVRASESLTLYTPGSGEKVYITISDSHGRLVYERTTVEEKEIHIRPDLSSRAKGIYYLKMISKDRVIHRKVVVQ